MMTFTPIVDLPEDDWDKVLAVNLRSVFLFCKYGVPHMPAGRRIVNISSVHAHETTRNVVPYATSKGGMEAFTRGFSEELADRKIRINCVAPGAVDTPMLWNNPNVKSGAEKIEGRGRQAGGHRRGDLLPRLRRGALHQRHDAGRRRRAAGHSVGSCKGVMAAVHVRHRDREQLPHHRAARTARPSASTRWRSAATTQRWREDFELREGAGHRATCATGRRCYRTHLGPGRYDWGFADETFHALRGDGHHADRRPVPLRRARLDRRFPEPGLAAATSPSTPAPSPSASRGCATTRRSTRSSSPPLFSAQYGWWNERLTSDRAFVTALKQPVPGQRAGDARDPGGPARRHLHPERVVRILPRRRARTCCTQANILNEKRFLSLDLTYGHPLNVTMYEYLLDNGMTRDEYHWFLDNQVKASCVMGNDYYVTNEHLVHEDGTCTASGEIFGYYVITHQYYERYRLPVMHTETNLADAEQAPGLAAGRSGRTCSGCGRTACRSRLHLVQPDRPGGLGHRAARRRRARQPARPVRPGPQDPARWARRTRN